eukprot:TRINITY_DN8642_c0_g2_i1.p2 TRINITY_DN8642_c0_g2~~TRINITY_DN8642_c0_g2_i1.p2  ORF type:complete len:511 (-),score=36.89 TRINITY_DN8642_c0_g2_i1:587-2119(-)
MNLTLAILCIVHVLLSLFSYTAGGLVDDVCASATFPLSTLCSTSFDLPTGGVTVLTSQSCTNNCCTWNCGSQCLARNPFSGGCIQRANIPCSGCSKQECGESCTDIPTGISIDTRTVSLCNSNMEQLVDRAYAVCSCLEEIVDFVENAASDLESSSLQAKSRALQAASDVFACAVSKGFDIQDNEQLQTQSAEQDGGTMIYAPTIDMSMYVDIGVAIATCAFGECSSLVDVFYNYFLDTVDAVSSGLENVLITKIQSPILAVEQKVDEILQQVQDLSDQIETEIQQCSSSASAPSTLSTFESYINDISSFYDKTTSLAQKVEDAIEFIDTSSLTLGTSYTTHLQNMLASGNTPQLDDAIEFLLGGGITDVLNDFSSYIYSDLPDVTSALQNLPSVGDALQDDLDRISSLCDFSSVENTIASVQTEAASLVSEIQSELSISISGDSLQVGIVSYNQWFSISLDLPCAEWVSITENSNGFTDSLSYPRIYACPFSMAVPMPNEHKPYVRITI